MNGLALGEFDLLREYARRNFDRLVVAGIILQVLGGMIQPITSYPVLRVFGWATSLLGTGLLLVGFAFYSKSKGRNPAWCLLALVPIIGWIILILLKDKTSLPYTEKVS
jgi:peptidoglycan/LPS O-acetylase OafA/YrhL